MSQWRDRRTDARRPSKFQRRRRRVQRRRRPLRSLPSGLLLACMVAVPIAPANLQVVWLPGRRRPTTGIRHGSRTLWTGARRLQRQRRVANGLRSPYRWRPPGSARPANSLRLAKCSPAARRRRTLPLRSARPQKPPNPGRLPMGMTVVKSRRGSQAARGNGCADALFGCRRRPDCCWIDVENHVAFPSRPPLIR